MEGYVQAPALAWSGWRLQIPGGPEGGQYHGYLASTADPNAWPAGIQEIYRAATPEEIATLGDVSSSAGGWESMWGGTVLHEGEDQSDYVYRSSAEMRPRPNASGGANVVTEYQAQRTAGFAVAPGNYRGIGLAPRFSVDDPRIDIVLPHVLPRGVTVKPRVAGKPIIPVTKPKIIAKPKAPVPKKPTTGPECLLPGHTCAVGPTGATAVVRKPSPKQAPIPTNTVADRCPTGSFIDAAGNCTSDWHNPYSLYLPKSPAPAPTVDASPSDFLPAEGQPLVDSTAAAGGSSFTDWLGQESIIPGVQNMYVAGGAALLVLFMFTKGKR